jgi:hypothetical protein
MQIKDQHRTPDVSVFYASGCFLTCSFPIIIEIKPYHMIHGDNPEFICTVNELTKNQLQEQVYFAFDTYTMLNDIHVLCAIEWHWDMLKFERGSNKLPSCKYTGEF